MAPRSVLMIAPYFPPRRRVGSLRPYKFARELPQWGWEPRVVHLATPTERATAEESIQLDALDRHAVGSAGDRTMVAGGSSLEHTHPRRSLVLDRLDGVVPVDGWLATLLAALPGVLRFARASRVDVVWSTADPWSSHVLAGLVAIRLGRPWIADYRDPWNLCGVRGRNRPAWVRSLDRQVEERVLASADRIVFTAERTRSRYAAARPRRAAKMVTITNAYAGEPRAWSADPVYGDRLVLRFFGRFRPLSSASRTIDVLRRVRALDPVAFSNLEVRSVGELSGEDRRRAEEAGVLDRFVSEEAVPYEAAAERLSTSDLLLVSVEPGREEILPAKLIDYLPVGRPIVALADSPEVADVLKTTGTGRMYGRDQVEEAARHLIACVWCALSGIPLSGFPTAQPEALRRYSSASTAARLAGLLDEVAEEVASTRSRAQTKSGVRAVDAGHEQL